MDAATLTTVPGPTAHKEGTGKVIHVRHQQTLHPLHLQPGATVEQVRGALYRLAGLPEDAQHLLRLTRPSGVLLPIGPSLPGTGETEPYILVVRSPSTGGRAPTTLQSDVEVATSIMEDILVLQKRAASLVHQAEVRVGSLCSMCEGPYHLIGT